MADRALTFMSNTWQVLGEMAPWLLFGFLAAGLLWVLVSPAWVQRHLGGRGLGPVVKSAVFGIPLPLCSCGVIPVGAGMYRQGASRGAASAFLLATPQTGVDSIFATYALLGPVFAVVRPIVALVTGVIGGGLIEGLTRGTGDRADDRARAESRECCDGGEASGDSAEAQPGNKLSRAARYGLVTLPGDIAGSLIVGVLIAGLLSTFVTRDALAPWLGGGMLAMVAMFLVGVPLYVCSTASIPLALGFMHMGASPGAALVFLITGPATNAATIAVVWKLMGRRATAIYLVTVIATAMGAGVLLDWGYAGRFSIDVTAHDHEHGVTWLGHVWSSLLLVVLAVGLIARRRARSLASADGPGESGPADQPDESLRLHVTGMRCQACVDATAGAIRDVAGVRSADVQLDGGRVTVAGHHLDRDAIVGAVESLGYHAEALDDRQPS